MSCQRCAYWDRQSEAYTQKGKHGASDLLIPSSGLCTYPVPIWIGHGLTAAEDGVACPTFKDPEDSI